MFKIVDFAHFFIDLQPIRPKFKKSTSHSMFTNPWSSYIPKITFLAFPQKKPCIKTSKKHYFRLIQPDCWPLRQKSKKKLPFTKIQTIFLDSHNLISKLSDISSRILFSSEKSEGFVFNRGLRHTLERSTLELATLFNTWVQLQPAIWLTAVKDESHGFFK
jgi:hypothetical protein